MIFEQQNQTHFPENKKKNSEKNLGKNKIWEKIFFGKKFVENNFENKISTSSNYT